ncbi:MAG: hypothetical protein QOE13_3341 [Gaiellaceae bacterium]|nr:hypothetical protein [Gaiellaceae bacterium]
MPRALLLCLLLAAALAGGILANAGAADPPRPLDTPLSVDLDGDGSPEAVVAHETACYTPDGVQPPPCAKDGLRSLVVEVVDVCGAAKVITLSREMDAISFARIVDADGDGHARELAFELRAGASGRGVQSKVVSFETGADGCVAVRKTLFSYPRPNSIGRRPHGTTFSSGGLTVHDFDKSTPGQELRTIDSYARPADPGCCPSFHRTTYWRYANGSYAPYATKLKKLPKLPKR